MINLKTKIAGFEYESILMNASGVHCYDKKELTELSASNATNLITKSATRDFREGNPEPRCVELALGSINSMGLPNLGFAYYFDYLLEKQRTEKALPFMSIAGLSPQENLAMLQEIQNSDLSCPVELNLSCPNVPGKPQVAYDFELTEQLLADIFKFYTKPLGLKLPPFFDLAHFDQMAAIINQFPIKFVTCINSIGNALFIDIEKESVVIKPKAGFGGIGGAYVKPTALANVRAFYTRLNPEIAIIGCGGVETGQDVFEHLLCGASMVQVGTALLKEGPTVFARLEKELLAVIAAKGYKSLDEFKGKLRGL